MDRVSNGKIIPLTGVEMSEVEANIDRENDAKLGNAIAEKLALRSVKCKAAIEGTFNHNGKTYGAKDSAQRNLARKIVGTGSSDLAERNVYPYPAGRYTRRHEPAH